MLTSAPESMSIVGQTQRVNELFIRESATDLDAPREIRIIHLNALLICVSSYYLDFALS